MGCFSSPAHNLGQRDARGSCLGEQGCPRGCGCKGSILGKPAGAKLGAASPRSGGGRWVEARQRSVVPGRSGSEPGQGGCCPVPRVRDAPAGHSREMLLSVWEPRRCAHPLPAVPLHGVLGRGLNRTAEQSTKSYRAACEPPLRSNVVKLVSCFYWSGTVSKALPAVRGDSSPCF